MLNLYVANLQAKSIDKRDIKLLDIVGLKSIVDLLRERELYRIQIRGFDYVNPELPGQTGKNFPKGEGGNNKEDLWKEGINMNDLMEIFQTEYKFDLPNKTKSKSEIPSS